MRQIIIGAEKPVPPAPQPEKIEFAQTAGIRRKDEFHLQVYRECATPRRIVWPSGAVYIRPALETKHQVPSELLLPSPGMLEEFLELAIYNTSTRETLVKVSSAVSFGPFAGGPVFEPPPVGGGFCDGPKRGNILRIPGHGCVSLLATAGGRWQITGGRHFELR